MEKRCNNISRLSQIWAGLLLLLFVTNYANITLFSHYHVVDGVTIVHSHFHSESHSSSHDNGGHSTNEFTLIQHLNNFVAEEQSSIFEIEVSSIDIAQWFNRTDESPIIGELCSLPLLRAPPTSAIFG